MRKFILALALLGPATAQVTHVYEESDTFGSTQFPPYSGTEYGRVVFTTNLPPMGWWLSPDWPLLRLQATHRVATVVPPSATGVPVRYGWASYVHVNNYHDHGGLTYTPFDEYVSEWTPGGPSGYPVSWERSVDITTGSYGNMLRFGGGLGPLCVISQVGNGNPSASSPDVWFEDETGARIWLPATVEVETTVTLRWTFDPPAITAWNGGSIGCGGVPNSTGNVARLELGGSPRIGDDSLWVSAWGLPPGAPGILAAAQGGIAPPAASTSLCLNPVGQFIVRLQVLAADSSGTIAARQPSAPLATSFLPVIDNTVHFQFWHRDATPLGFNVTDAYRVRYEP